MFKICTNKGLEMKSMAFFIRLLALIPLVVLSGCKNNASPDVSLKYSPEPAIKASTIEYIFAVHPLHNSRRYFEVYQPLVDFINRNTKEFSLHLEASNDYAHFEEKLHERKFHFALPNPYQSVQSVKDGYTIFGKMGDDEKFRGIIVVRKNSNIKSVQDLHGAEISFPSATALAAAMMPKYFLKTQGLDVEKDAICRYVGSQESSIMNVYLGKTKAGCTWPQPWETFLAMHPEVDSTLTIKWQTEPLINNGLVVRNDVPAQHLKIFSDLIFHLQEKPEGKKILGSINISCFVPLSQNEYMSRVNTFLKKYINLFGKLPGLGVKK